MVATESPSLGWDQAELTVNISYSLVGSWRTLCQKTDDQSTYITTINTFFDDGSFNQEITSFGEDGTCQKEEFQLLIEGVYTVGNFVPAVPEARELSTTIESIGYNGNEQAWSLAADCQNEWVSETVKTILTNYCRDTVSDSTIFDIYRASGRVLMFGSADNEHDLTSAASRPISLSVDPAKIGKKIK